MTDSGRGSVDLSDFIGKLKEFYPGIERDEVYVKAIKKGERLLAGRFAANSRIEEYRIPSSYSFVMAPSGCSLAGAR